MNNEIKINVPEGMEIDKENSTFECIKFKPKWIPKRGDIAAAGSDHGQIVLIGEYIKQSIIGFDVQCLAVLNMPREILTVYYSDNFWVSEEASASEKELFIKKLNEQGYTYDPNDPRVIYKKEKELPKTWEEFCENNPITPNECYINSFSLIKSTNSGFTLRDCFADANSLPSEEYAEAILALCKLIQLRDCYNDGWKPDWKDASSKFTIRFYSGLIIRDVSSNVQGLLTFKTQQLREKFCNNFKDLIEQAKLLL